MAVWINWNVGCSNSSDCFKVDFNALIANFENQGISNSTTRLINSPRRGCPTVAKNSMDAIAIAELSPGSNISRVVYELASSNTRLATGSVPTKLANLTSKILFNP